MKYRRRRAAVRGSRQRRAGGPPIKVKKIIIKIDIMKHISMEI
jgi:hypothetical protein